MKIFHIWSIIATSLYFGSSAANSATQASPQLLQRLIEVASRSRNPTSSNLYDDATTDLLLIPRLQQPLSQEDYPLPSRETRNHHVRRNSPYSHRITRLRRPTTTHARLNGNTLSVGPCGFGSPLDRISRSRFPCRNTLRRRP